MGGATGGVAATEPVGQRLDGGPPLVVASSRSAVVRLTAVAAALDGAGLRPVVAGVVDGLGRYAPRTTECLGCGPDEVVDTVTEALELTRPSVAIIAGDADAAVGCAVAAARLNVPIVRVGAGLRCGDGDVRGEINRIVLDAMADRLYTDNDDASQRLLGEGVAGHRVRHVGNTLADVVLRWRGLASEHAIWR